MNEMSDDQTPPQDHQDPQDPKDPQDSHDGTPPPPPPPHATAPRPLLRRETDTVFAGVAGGLADYLGVDATVVRVAFVVLTIFGGIGIPLYLVAWAGLRTPSMPESHVEQWFRGAPNPVALIALAVGFVILLSVMHDGPGDGVGWGLLLLFGGWLLFRADERAVSGGTSPSTTAGDLTDWPPSRTWHGPGGASAPPPPVAPPPAPPRPRSILGRLTVGAMLAALGVAALLDQLGAVALEPVQYAALAMTITGLGLIVGAWLGRAYGLIAIGLLLVPVMLITSLAPLPVRSGVGDYRYRPLSVTAIEDEYAVGAGQLELDLSAVDFAGTTTRVTVSVGAGQTEIIVPDDVTVAVAGEIRAGQMELFGNRTIGRPFVGDINEVDEGSGAGRLELSVDNGVGDLTVRRASEER